MVRDFTQRPPIMLTYRVYPSWTSSTSTFSPWRYLSGLGFLPSPDFEEPGECAVLLAVTQLGGIGLLSDGPAQGTRSTSGPEGVLFSKHPAWILTAVSLTQETSLLILCFLSTACTVCSTMYPSTSWLSPLLITQTMHKYIIRATLKFPRYSFKPH